jgi:D-alanyl-D-alanine carboxypeptidase
MLILQAKLAQKLMRHEPLYYAINSNDETRPDSNKPGDR